MTDRALKVVLDDHVFDRLEADMEAADLVKGLILQGRVVVLMPRAFRNQLWTRSNGMPKWLPIHHISDTTSEADVLVSDDAQRRRHAQSSGRFEALTYGEFVELLRLLQLDTQLSL